MQNESYSSLSIRYRYANCKPQETEARFPAHLGLFYQLPLLYLCSGAPYQGHHGGGGGGGLMGSVMTGAAAATAGHVVGKAMGGHHQ